MTATGTRNSSLVRIELFGVPQILVAGKTLGSLQPKVISLLAFLMLHRPGPIPRDRIAFALNPDMPEGEARAAVRRYLYLLLRAVANGAEPAILATAKTLEWNPAFPTQVDVDEFDRFRSNPQTLEQAVQLYRGDLLEGVEEEWIEPLRERLRSAALDAHAILIATLRDEGRYVEAIARCESALRIDPWREECVRDLMALRSAAGDRAAALQTYADFALRLKSDLGVDPMPETTRVHSSIAQSEGLAQAPSPAQERLGLSSSLPFSASSFVGRSDDQTRLKRLLATSRVVTLTGVGGVGKSRLAFHVAGEMAQVFSSGIFLVELAPIASEQFLNGALLAAFGLTNDGKDPTDKLATFLRGRRVLLVLDNCEHLIEACAARAFGLLRELPNLAILATSREPLNIDGEQIYHLEPMTENDAASLFVERALSADPRFSLTDGDREIMQRLCLELDRIPLAIELAAARLKSLSLEDLRDGLARRFELLSRGRRSGLPHHQTLRRTIDWSYDLLDDGERALFARLSVFRGGCTLEAAQDICAGESNGAGILDGIERLIEKSLLTSRRQGSVRFQMLETIREYAAEKLAESEESAAVAARHAFQFVDVVETTVRHFGQSGESTAFESLGNEIENIRAAFSFASSEHPRVALRLAGAIGPYWAVRGEYREAGEWLERVLSVPIEPADAKYEATALHWRAEYLRNQGYMDEALALDERAFAIRSRLDDKADLADSLTSFAANEFERGRFEEAYRLDIEALAMFEACEDYPQVGRALHNLGAIATLLGNFAEAEALLRRSLAVFRKLGSRRGEAWALVRLGFRAYCMRDFAAAQDYYEQSLARRRQLGDRPGIASCLHTLGVVAAARRDFDAAAALQRECLEICWRYGFSPRIIEVFERTAEICAARDDFPTAARLCGGAANLRRLHDHAIEPLDWAEHEPVVLETKRRLGEAFEAEYGWGTGATREDLATMALAVLAPGENLS